MVRGDCLAEGQRGTFCALAPWVVLWRMMCISSLLPTPTPQNTNVRVSNHTLPRSLHAWV